MLEKVKELAMEKFAGDQQLVDEFIKGFAKEAMAARNEKSTIEDLSDKLRQARERGPLGSAASGLGKAFGEGLGGLMITTGVGALGEIARSLSHDRLRTRFLQSLEQVLKTNPIVSEEARKSSKSLETVKTYAETIFRFAPNIAADANLLSTLLANAVHGSSIDPMTIKTITDLERTYKDNNTFTPKSYI